ncbi:hypothetical protein CBOM_06240 [Ceraceosorus bombacis]|uniref:Xylanolytic transcriptional activator regulatory domain-containing protein n=1 Tax=Ceraceosorus bombacis TaxID=401625 RepID=A0A0P1BJR6_9BASI|nr:hypothetical protein CBOM_06240 [Ceraceosorus bombacis]
MHTTARSGPPKGSIRARTTALSSERLAHTSNGHRPSTDSYATSLAHRSSLDHSEAQAEDGASLRETYTDEVAREAADRHGQRGPAQPRTDSSVELPSSLCSRQREESYQSRERRRSLQDPFLKGAFIRPLDPAAHTTHLQYRGSTSGMAVASGSFEPYLPPPKLSRLRSSSSAGTSHTPRDGIPDMGQWGPDASTRGGTSRTRAAWAGPPHHASESTGFLHDAATTTRSSRSRTESSQGASSRGDERNRYASASTALTEDRPHHHWTETFDDSRFAGAGLEGVYDERRGTKMVSSREPRMTAEPLPHYLASIRNLRGSQRLSEAIGTGPDICGMEELFAYNEIIDVTIPEIIIDRLFALYWMTCAMHWPLLYKPKIPVKNGVPQISEKEEPLLFNAICALVSASIDDETESALLQDQAARAASEASGLANGSGDSLKPVTSREISTIFFVRAKYFLMRINHESSLSNVAALMFMALHECGAGRMSQCAQYSGAASRMSLDIGLHRHLDVSRALGHSYSVAEDQCRRRLFWGCYMMDKCLSLQLGRPPILRDVETDCPFPSADEKFSPDEKELWTDGPGAAMFFRPPTLWKLRDAKPRSITFQIAGAKLAQCAEGVIAQYNTIHSKVDPAKREPTGKAVARCHRDLVRWREEMPSCLDISRSENQMPQLLSQYLWWRAIMIVLHRPYIKTKFPEHHGDMPSSHVVCSESARDICQLFQLYEETFDIRKSSTLLVYVLYTSATISLANTTSPDPVVVAEAKQQLEQTLRWLGKMGKSWSAAEHHRQVVAALLERKSEESAGKSQAKNGVARERASGQQSAPREANDSGLEPMESKIQVAPLVSLPEQHARRAVLAEMPLAPALGPPDFSTGFQSFSSNSASAPTTAAFPDAASSVQRTARTFIQDYIDFSPDWSVPQQDGSQAPYMGSPNDFSDAQSYLRAADQYMGAVPLAHQDRFPWLNFQSDYLNAFAQLSVPPTDASMLGSAVAPTLERPSAPPSATAPIAPNADPVNASSRPSDGPIRWAMDSALSDAMPR